MQDISYLERMMLSVSTTVQDASSGVSYTGNQKMAQQQQYEPDSTNL